MGVVTRRVCPTAIHITIFLLAIFTLSGANDERYDMPLSWEYHFEPQGFTGIAPATTVTVGREHIYMAGRLGWNVHFPGTSHPNNLCHRCMYVSAHDPQTGSLIWIRTLGSNITDQSSVNKIAVHPDGQSIVLTGEVTAPLGAAEAKVFVPEPNNPSGRSYLLYGESDGFVAQLAINDGSLMNFRIFGTMTRDFSYDLVMKGDIAIMVGDYGRCCYWIEGSKKFGAGLFEMPAAIKDPEPTEWGYDDDPDGFILQYNVKTNRFIGGTVLQGKRRDSIRSAALDSQGNLYVVGEFSGTQDPTMKFGSIQVEPRVHAGGHDSFLAALDAETLEWKWVKTAESRDRDVLSHIEIRDDAAYVAGYFVHADLFDFDGITVEPVHEKYASEFREIVIARIELNPLGPEAPIVRWVRPIGSVTQVQNPQITTIGEDVYVAGSYQGQVSAGTFELPDTGGMSVFLMKFNKLGQVQWGATSSNSARLYSLAGISSTPDPSASDQLLVMATSFQGVLQFGGRRIPEEGSIGFGATSLLLRIAHGGVVLHDRTVEVTEGDPAGATYSLSLRTQPLSPVTIHMVPDTGVTVTPDTLVFTSNNWFTPQTANVTIPDNSVALELVYLRNITHSGVSEDEAYNARGLGSQALLVSENDFAPITDEITPTTADVTTTFTLTVRGRFFGNSKEEFVAVLLDGVPCANSVYVSSTLATCLVQPPGDAYVAREVKVTVATVVRDLRTKDHHVPLSLTYPLPILDSVFPTLGRWQGKTSVTLSGSYFGHGKLPVRIMLGATECVNPELKARGTIACESTPATPGLLVNVTITVGRQQAFLVNGYQFSSKCDPQCVALRQYCAASLSCVCEPGWTGTQCEIPILSITTGAPTVAEGGSGVPVAFQIAERPATPLHVNISVQSDRVRLSESSVSFTVADWSLPQTVTVIGVNDLSRLGNASDTLIARSSASSSQDARLHALTVLSPVQILESQPRILSYSPRTSPFNGTNVRVQVADIDDRAVFTIGGVQIPVRITNYTSTVVQTDQGSSSLVFNVSLRTPRVTTTESYVSLMVRNVDGTEHSVQDGLFYTDRCPEEGQYGVGADCRDCPTGAVCPGGYRMWPLPGYWNDNEFEGKVYRCTAPAETKCLGGRDALCGVGYEGRLCGTCAPDFYRFNSQCLACNKQVPVAMLLSIQTVFFGILLLAIVMLSKPLLNTFLTFMTVLQLLWALGRNENSRLPKWAQSVFSWTALVTFDLEFVRPECEIHVSPIWVYYTSLATLLVGLALLPVLTAIRSLVRSFFFKKRGKAGFARYNITRLYRATTIVLSFMYTQVCSQTFSILYCRKVHGKWYLASDPEVQCFKGQHSLAFGVAVVVVVVYCLGLPLLISAFLHRSSKAQQLHTGQFQKKFGYWFERFRPQVYNFRASLFATTFALIVSSVFLWQVPPGQFALCMTALGTELILVLWLVPFLRHKLNAFVILLISASLAVVSLNFLAWKEFGLTERQLNIALPILLVIWLVIGGILARFCIRNVPIREYDMKHEGSELELSDVSPDLPHAHDRSKDRQSGSTKQSAGGDWHTLPDDHHGGQSSSGQDSGGAGDSGSSKYDPNGIPAPGYGNEAGKRPQPGQYTDPGLDDLDAIDLLDLADDNNSSRGPLAPVAPVESSATVQSRYDEEAVAAQKAHERADEPAVLL